MKYTEAKVTFSEVPDEVTLCINISGCPVHCEGCHSSYLAENIGTPLDYNSIYMLIKQNKGISCISFMGGDADPSHINSLAEYVQATFPTLKICWYSGRQELSPAINLRNFDYIKLGPFIKDKGGLDNPDTNQKFYKVLLSDSSTPYLKDITHTFQHKDHLS